MDGDPNGGHHHKTIPRSANSNNQRLVLRVLSNQELSIRSVCIPADSGECERPIGDVRGSFAQELPCTALRLNGDLVFCKRNGFLDARIWVKDEIAVPRMLVDEFQLSVLSIGFLVGLALSCSVK